MSVTLVAPIILTKEQKNRIEALAASFVEGSGFLMGLSNAIATNVKTYMAEEMRRKQETRRE